MRIQSVNATQSPNHCVDLSGWFRELIAHRCSYGGWRRARPQRGHPGHRQMALRDGHEVIGSQRWAGLAANTPVVPSSRATQGVIAQGGTLLGTARYNLAAGGRSRTVLAPSMSISMR